MHKTLTSHRVLRGFTLLEMIFTIVLLAILAKVAMMKLVTPATLTLPAQAQSVADMLRRAQNLAAVRGQRVRVNVATSGTNGRLALECIPTTSPCATDASLTLDQGVVLGGSSVYFNSLGVPINIGGSPAGAPLATDTNFTVAYTTGGALKTYTVTVAALTGRVSVSN